MSDEQDDLPGDTTDAPPTPVGPGPDMSPGADAGGDNLPSFEEIAAAEMGENTPVGEKTAADLEAVFDVPVRIAVVLGRTKMPVANLLKMEVGTVVELDRQVGEAIDIYVNERLVARGEIVLVDDRLGVTMTEIIKAA